MKPISITKVAYLYLINLQGTHQVIFLQHNMNMSTSAIIDSNRK